MGKYLGIKKTSEKDELHYYELNTNDSGGYKGYIGIDSVKKQLTFFDEKNCNILKVIDFTKVEEQIGLIPHLPKPLYGPLIIKVWEAIRENNFPDNLDYCA